MLRSEFNEKSPLSKSFNEEHQNIVLRNKSKDIAIPLKHLVEIGSKDINLLKKTVLFNFNGSIKSYARNSVFCLDANSPLR
jgi:hypothetical protein